MLNIALTKSNQTRQIEYRSSYMKNETNQRAICRNNEKLILQVGGDPLLSQTYFTVRMTKSR
uniref:Uncharacterized protein n=1 Tax=Nelumbo nucifera TaxID=4432 RepID=A0A822YN66_NELNU|nr:TPA_asm: hypothetical protein HUJ06_006254 [Nelumbo nucifera]